MRPFSVTWRETQWRRVTFRCGRRGVKEWGSSTPSSGCSVTCRGLAAGDGQVSGFLLRSQRCGRVSCSSRGHLILSSRACMRWIAFKPPPYLYAASGRFRNSHLPLDTSLPVWATLQPLGDGAPPYIPCKRPWPYCNAGLCPRRGGVHVWGIDWCLLVGKCKPPTTADERPTSPTVASAIGKASIAPRNGARMWEERRVRTEAAAV